MKSQQQALGIVAVISETGKISRFDECNWGGYETWVEFMLKPKAQVNDLVVDFTIHTISVDNKEWSVGEEYYFGYSGKHKITSFRWRNGEWEAESGGGYILVRGLSKLPPSLQDRSGSQPGKEDEHQKSKEDWITGFHKVRVAYNDYISSLCDELFEIRKQIRPKDHYSPHFEKKQAATRKILSDELHPFINEQARLPMPESQPSQPGREEDPWGPENPDWITEFKGIDLSQPSQPGKSHKRRFIESHIIINASYEKKLFDSEYNALEKELMEAIEKDSKPSQPVQGKEEAYQAMEDAHFKEVRDRDWEEMYCILDAEFTDFKEALKSEPTDEWSEPSEEEIKAAAREYADKESVYAAAVIKYQAFIETVQWLSSYKNKKQ